MKSKVNVPSRGKSNPPLKNLPPSSLLEEQTKKMEQQLKELKDMMAQKAMSREATSESQEGSRWQSANPNLPIRNYPKAVLETKGKVSLNSTQGNKNTGSLTFTKQPREKIAREKLSSREKLAPIPGVTSGTPSNTSFKNKENESQKDFFKDTLSSEQNLQQSSMTSLPTPNSKPKPKQQKPSVSQAEPVDRSAENNLKKALQSQKETDEVSGFLQEIGLPQYIQVFKDNGFDDLETVMEIQTKHLVDMKIPAGHQIKLTKRIENLRANNPNSSFRNTLPAQKTTTQAATESINMQQHIKSNADSYYGQKGSDYIQLAEPTREMAIGDDRKEGGELLQGAFNEAESHQSFLEALNEWRSGKAKPAEPEKKEPRAKESRSKKVRFAEPVPEKEERDDSVDYISTKPKTTTKPKEEKKEEDKKSFFFSGASSWNQAEVPTQQEHGTGMSPRSLPKAKLSCWNCYRLIPEEEVISVGQKHVCSEQCAKAYRDLNSTKCTKKGCSNTFLKEDGLLIEGKWYCSEKCAPSAEELLMEEQRMLKRLQNEEGFSPKESQPDAEEEVEEEEEEGADDEERDVAFELSVDVGNKKEVLTLAELEEKYKNLNKLAEKAQGENEFEDSLN